MNEFFLGSRALSICQYNRQRFAPEIIRDVLRTHPLAILGGRVCENLYYEAPDLVLGRPPEARRVAWMITQLQRVHQVEAERAQLLAREQVARREAEAAQRRSAFLAEASKLLASSLNYATTLANIARLMVTVPGMADWCVIDLVEDGEIQRVAAAHADPTKDGLVQQLRRYPPDPRKEQEVPEVLRTGQSQIFVEVSDSLLESIAHNADYLSSTLSISLVRARCAHRRDGRRHEVSSISGLRGDLQKTPVPAETSFVAATDRMPIVELRRKSLTTVSLVSGLGVE